MPRPNQQNQFYQREAARIVEKLEVQLMRYPVQRNWQLERALAMETQRRKETEQDLQSCRDRLTHCNGVHNQVVEFHETVRMIYKDIADK